MSLIPGEKAGILYMWNAEVRVELDSHLLLRTTNERSIHDSMNRPKIEFIAYICYCY